jgi:hypothetical protein
VKSLLLECFSKYKKVKKSICIILVFAIFSCKKSNENQEVSNEKTAIANQNLAQESKDSIAVFENALTYTYWQNGKKEELWIFVNEQKKELLFIPNDDMIQAVISYPDGTYKIFGTEHDGKKIVLTQTINAIEGQELDEPMLKKTKDKQMISQKNIQQKDILCEGFTLKYLKMEGGETLFATTQIPINSFQLYGFSRLDGDCKLPISLDYINIFKKNQLLTHVERDNFKLELLNYGPNPYEFNVKDYKEK